MTDEKSRPALADAELVHPRVAASAGFSRPRTAIHRGSTVLFERQADARDDWRRRSGYTYGLYGTPTMLELAARIAEIEGARAQLPRARRPGRDRARRPRLLPAGDHALLPDNVYGPNRELADGLLAGLGIEVRGLRSPDRRRHRGADPAEHAS